MDIKVKFDSEEDIKTSIDTGSIQYGQLEIGTTKTGEAGTQAVVTNSGSSSHAILNFTIPKGDRGEKGAKGDKGDTPDLSNYATKEYVEQEIATFDFIKIVDELPETGLENRVYLVPKADTQTQDLFDEYVWVNGKWEWITTKQIEVDLTDYAKLSDIPPEEVAVSATEPTTEEKVWFKKGKNLFNINGAFITSTSTSYSVSGNVITVSGLWNAKQRVKVRPNTDYTISASIEVGYIGIYTLSSSNICFVDTGANMSTTFNTGDNEEIEVTFVTRSQGTTSMTATFTNVQLEAGTQASTYEPYIDKEIYVKNANGVFEKFVPKVELNVITGAECETGRFINGYKEYVKRINCGAMPNATTSTINTGLTNIRLTRPAIGYFTDSTQWTVWSLDSNSTGVSWYVTSNGGKIKITTTEDKSTMDEVIVEIYYIKTA